jgi:4-amino-4-deoxy-L-arabinose transferase-like glycosyltransferase
MGRVFLAAVLITGLAIRLALALSIDRPLVSDERDYDALAWTLATTGRYTVDGRPTAYRAVGYPAFLAGVYSLAGRSPRAVRVVQSVLDTATALLLFVALRGRSRRAAVAAAAVWAFYPPAIATTTLLYSESLFCFLLVLAAVGLLREPGRSPPFRVALGVLFGALTLVKVATLYLFALLPWVALRGEGKWRRAALLLAGLLLVVAPWIWRNARVAGVPTLAFSSASSFLIANHPNATGGYAPNVPETMRPRAADEAGAAREAARAARDYIRAYPGRFLAGVGQSWAHFFMGEGELAVLAFHPNPADPATPYRAKARELGAGTLLLFWIPYAALLLAGVAAWMTRRWDPLSGLFLALAAAWLLVHGITFGGGRFHAPWMPFLAAFAAERWTRAPGGVLLRGARLAAWAVFATLCLALWGFEAAAYF